MHQRARKKLSLGDNLKLNSLLEKRRQAQLLILVALLGLVAPIIGVLSDPRGLPNLVTFTSGTFAIALACGVLRSRFDKEWVKVVLLLTGSGIVYWYVELFTPVFPNA